MESELKITLGIIEDFLVVKFTLKKKVKEIKSLLIF